MKKWLKNILLKNKFFKKIFYQHINKQYRKYYSSFSSSSYSRDFSFYTKLIGPTNLIFDVGANRGNKTDVFCQLSNKVIAVEPDEKNVEILRTRFKGNKKVIIENVALSSSNKIEKMFVLGDGDERNTLSIKWKGYIENPLNLRSEQMGFSDIKEVQTLTLQELICKYGIPDYIKIDVEGYELEVLKGLSQKIRLISFESNLPEFLEETIQCIKLLYKLSGTSKYNYSFENSFMLDEWIGYDEFSTIIKNIEFRTIEIFCRMEL